jgi:phage gp46-like protein
MTDYKLYIDETGKLAMSYERGDSFVNNILLSVFIKKGSFFAVPWLGSLLHTIKKITSDSVLLAKSYVETALKWMVDCGRVTNLVVITEVNDAGNAIAIMVTGKKQNGDNIDFKTFYPVV